MGSFFWANILRNSVMRRRKRHRRRRSQHSVGRQVLLDPASGIQEGEELHRVKRKRVIHGGGLVLPRSRSRYPVGSSSELKCKHTIFLSYSRSQLDFVMKVCEDLEGRLRFPFFDIRETALPLGERFEEPLLQAAQQCRLAVVVVSEEYFSSKWPMRELVEFMRAKSDSNPNLKILPLFYKLSIRDLDDESKQERWFAEWAKWAEVDVGEYKEAFEKVKKFNGIQFNQGKDELGSYQKRVVRRICNLVPPDIKLYDGHVKGISNMYKDYTDKIQGIAPSGKFGVRVIGYYGVGGTGKTTMCKTLCNKLSRKFQDKVCHVELTPRLSSSQKLSHLKEVLKKLTSTSDEILQELNEDQCVDILCNSDSREQKTFPKTFLALDNVWDDTTLIGFVRMFIRHAAFHDGSVVMVTGRCLRTLEYIGLDSAQCFKVPELSKKDARDLFLFHAADGRSFDSEDDINPINGCVARCYFKKGSKEGSHYLPLALKVLGMHLGGLGKTPRQWLDKLPLAKDFGLHYPEDNPVYSVIRLNYDRLLGEDQELFMDITIYCSFNIMNVLFMGEIMTYDWRLWLSLVHCKSLEAIQDQLQRLKEKGLLEYFDPTSGSFSIHDLYLEFAKWESQVKSNCEGFIKQRWIYEYGSYPATLERSPTGDVWKNLIRVRVGEGFYSLNPGNLSCEGIQWSYCSTVVVLHLHGLRKLRGVLNLKDLYSLRSLQLLWLHQLAGVEGLEDLKYLTFIQWCNQYLDPSLSRKDKQLGRLPASLKVLQVSGGGTIIFGKDIFSCCTNLCNLKLRNVDVCDGIGLDQCISLESLELLAMTKVVLPDLHKFSRLQVLRFEGYIIFELSGLHTLGHLRELHVDCLQESPNFLGLQNLHHLGLPFCLLRRIVELGTAGLPLLRHLNLSDSALVELPNLSKMIALEVLEIHRTFIKIGEEEIVMLEKLPRLRPLQLGFYPTVILNVVRRKLTKSSGDSYMESDLGVLPTTVRDIVNLQRNAFSQVV